MHTRRLQDARHAMLLARVDMDDYLENRAANPEEFEKRYEAVRVTTEEYVRTVKEHFQERYSFLNSSTPEPSEPQLS